MRLVLIVTRKEKQRNELNLIAAQLEAGESQVLRLTEDYIVNYPDDSDGWIFRGRALQLNSEFKLMLSAARRAVEADSESFVAKVFLMEALALNGFYLESLKIAEEVQNEKKYDPSILLAIGNFYLENSFYSQSLQIFERLRILMPSDILAIHRLATLYTSLGNLQKAEELYDFIIKKKPSDADAYYSRAVIRSQTISDNHIDQLNDMLKKSPASDHTFCYALAKEYEDIKDWEKSFFFLKRGADSHSKLFPYDGSYDIDTVKNIKGSFSKKWLSEKSRGYDKDSPIFVLGMPRSGTTLIDRVLSSHSQITSAGESNEFSMSVMRACGTHDGKGNIPFDISVNLDFYSLGEDYCRSQKEKLPNSDRFLDKTPFNFFLIGLIKASLPKAKIIHVRRNPVASCYAIYKTLFRNGYNFSYNLENTADFYASYLNIMNHWRDLVPDIFLDVSYEDFVSDQKNQTNKLLNWCELDWEEEVLEFTKNTSPTLTASAAQVRRPIYTSSIDQWRNYENQLQPLINRLAYHGISIN